MIKATHRVMIYVVVSLGFFAGGLILDATQVSGNGFLLGINGMILSVIVEVYLRTEKTEGPVEVIYGERNLRIKYDEMKEKAYTKFYAIWSGEYTAFHVEDYFKKEGKILSMKPKNFDLLRLVNIEDSELTAHIQLTKEQIKEDKYSIKKTDIENFEIHYCDYRGKNDEVFEQVLLVFLKDNRHPHIGTYLDSENTLLTECVKSVRDMFIREWDKGEELSEDLLSKK